MSFTTAAQLWLPFFSPLPRSTYERMLSGDAVELLAHVGPDGQEAEHIVHGVEDEGVLLWEVVQDVGQLLEGPSHDDGGSFCERGRRSSHGHSTLG